MWGSEQHFNKPCRALLAVAETFWLSLLVCLASGVAPSSEIDATSVMQCILDTQGGGQPLDAGLVAASEVVNRQATQMDAASAWFPLCLRRLLAALPGAWSHGRLQRTSILSASAFASACRAPQ